MAAARRLRPPLRAATFETLIGLLACTGLRIGEVIRLDREDVDLEGRLLTVRNSKFGKSREVLLHPSTVGALTEYGKRRDRRCRHAKDRSFFITTRGSRLCHPTIHQPFRALLKQAGVEHPSPSRRVRIHDLRHSFAVKTLLGWYRDGGDVAARMPLLSTYMGHVDPAASYWYLSAGRAAGPRRQASGAGHGRAVMSALAPTLNRAPKCELDIPGQPAHNHRIPRHLPAAAVITQKRTGRAPSRLEVSPILANLFMHYAFDTWMVREIPGCPFERYADDAVVHCKSRTQAEYVLGRIAARLGEVGLRLHPDKTRIVYCKDGRRRDQQEHVSFTFLGYAFRARGARTKDGRCFTSFLPAISPEALKAKSARLRELRIHRRTDLTLDGLARWLNPSSPGGSATTAGSTGQRSIPP